MTSRRRFIFSMAAGLLGTGCRHSSELPPGEWLGANVERGHRLTQPWEVSSLQKTGTLSVAIVGGGIAGLSAAWRLHKSGLHDFRLFELENDMGGNSRAGKNGTTAFPWGAHYLPVPDTRLLDVRELLADMGILQGRVDDPSARFDERQCVFAPQERLFYQGRWHDGLFPPVAPHSLAAREYLSFQQQIKFWRERVMRDGRRAFTLPAHHASTDPELLALDQLTFYQWLQQQGFRSQELYWYLDYACRDDYGTPASATSAWYGLHYFCSRHQTAGQTTNTLLTWPEGNARLARALAAPLQHNLQNKSLARRVELPAKKGMPFSLMIDNTAENVLERWQADWVIFAAPLFTVPRVIPELPTTMHQAMRGIHYAPWVVSNFHLNDLPQTPPGEAALAWDNVIYQSPSLGYVNATHQHLAGHVNGTVLTHYQSLSGGADSRCALLKSSRAHWGERLFGELTPVHHDLRAMTERLDIFLSGHAMRSPVPGTRQWCLQQNAILEKDGVAPGDGRLLFAHADRSGYSVFEEANFWGNHAARLVLARV